MSQQNALPDPDRVVLEWSIAHHGLITRDAAVALGMSPRAVDRRVESGRWVALHPGVYRQTGSNTWRSDALAACLWAGDDAVASHRSAAALWSLLPPERPIEITCPRRLRSTGIVNHRLLVPRSSRTRVDGIPVTTTHRTVVDVAGILGATPLEEVLDDALARQLVSLPRLELELQNSPPNKKGIAELRRLVGERSDGQRPNQSRFETRLLKLLRSNGLPDPVRQFEIWAEGKLLARPDFCYPEYRVIIEADSYRWHSSKTAWDKDVTRYNALAAHGWLIVRITWQQLHCHPRQVVQTIERAIGRNHFVF